MKHFGIASPRLAFNAAFNVSLVVLALVGSLPLAITHKLWIAYFFPIPFLLLFILKVAKHRNAFVPFWMSKCGIHNHKLHIPWSKIKKVELIDTEVITRGGHIHRLSIGIGDVVYGDLFNQNPATCIVLPLSRRNISLLHQFGSGKSPALDRFLAGQLSEFA